MNESPNKNLVIPELGLVHLFLEGSGSFGTRKIAWALIWIESYQSSETEKENENRSLIQFEYPYRIDLNRLDHLSGEVSINEDKMGKDPRKQQ